MREDAEIQFMAEILRKRGQNMRYPHTEQWGYIMKKDLEMIMERFVVYFMAFEYPDKYCEKYLMSMAYRRLSDKHKIDIYADGKIAITITESIRNTKLEAFLVRSGLWLRMKISVEESMELVKMNNHEIIDIVSTVI